MSRRADPIELRAALATFALACLLAAIGCDAPSREAPRRCPPGDSAHSSQASFLAVGDFGQPPGWIPLLDPRQAVATALDEAHRCDPADGLWLLGDNFYPAGLTDENFEARVRDTVVEPFCRFLSIASACRLAPVERRPVPIVAVMGNHDYEPPVDGTLEKQRLPERVPEWRMPAGVAEVFELPGELSVIALDSVRLHAGAPFDEVERALAAARGRFRIVLAHHPLTVGGRDWETRYAEGLLAAIRRSGRVVHLLLAGHEHHLAVSPTGRRELPLQVVAGSGARVRAASHELLGESARWQALGYVRIDVVSGDALRVRLRAVPRFPASLWREVESVSEWSVSHDGVLEPIAERSFGVGRDDAFAIGYTFED